MDARSHNRGRSPQSKPNDASAARPAFHAATIWSLFVCALIAAAPLPSHSAPISEKDYRELVTSTSRSCYATQRAAATSQGIPEAEIRDYCSCYARALYDRNMTVVQYQEFLKVGKEQGYQAALDYVLRGRDPMEIGRRCAR